MVCSMHTCRFLIILFCLSSLNRLSCSSFVVELSNGTVDREYTSFISQTSIHVYEFASLVGSYRVETSVNSSDVASPVLIYVNHQTYEESWSLPLDMMTSSGRVACPVGLNNITNNITIRIQTFSSDPIQYSLKVVSIVSNVIQLDQEVSALFNPAFPTYFVMDIAAGVEVIDISLTSHSELCSLVSVTNYSCPPNFIYQPSVSTKDYSFTMTQAGNLRVKRSDFGGERLMVLFMSRSASECETTAEYSMNVSSENYAKNTSLIITAGNNRFWGPILILTAIYLVPFVMFAIIIGFELLLIHSFPKLTQFFSMFSRVRRVTRQDPEINYKPVKETDKTNDVVLDVVTLAHEAPSEEINQATESVEDTFEAAIENYKLGLAKDDVSYHARGTYYFEIVNNKEIVVQDLNLKSDRELKNTGMLFLFLVIIVGIFYIVPAVQVSYIRLEQMVSTGELDICYFNFKCERDYNSIRGFNSIWSNISYILLGILALIITVVKNISFVRELRAQGNSTTGVPQVFGIYYALAVGLFFEGIMSGIYHICPSLINFQFDTTFMYILTTLIFIKLYNNRHPDSEVKPCGVFILLSIIVLFTCISLFKENTMNFTGRIILTIGISISTLITTYLVYNLFINDLLYFYYKDLRKHKSILRITRQLFWPKYNKSRIYLSMSILFSFIIFIILLWIPGFFNSVASGIIAFFLFQMVFYIIYYWILKLIKKEFLHRPFVFFFALSLLLSSFVFWIPALYFYSTASSHWELSPANARTFNKDCIFLDFYDSHDMWHCLSAFAIFTTYLSTLLMDDNLYFVQRDKIRVF